MDEVKAIKPNKLGMMFANTIRAGRDTLNYPGKVAGIGAGDLLFGQGPELAEEMAHGFPPYKGTGYGTRVDTRLLDLAGTPTFGLGTLIAKGPSLMSKLIRRGASGVTDEGRREFMKKGAALAGGAAASGTGANTMVDLIRSAGKEAIPAATAAAARGGFSSAALGSLSKWASTDGAEAFMHGLHAMSQHPRVVAERFNNPIFLQKLEELKAAYPELTDDILVTLFKGEDEGLMLRDKIPALNDLERAIGNALEFDGARWFPDHPFHDPWARPEGSKLVVDPLSPNGSYHYVDKQGKSIPWEDYPKDPSGKTYRD